MFLETVLDVNLATKSNITIYLFKFKFEIVLFHHVEELSSSAPSLCTWTPATCGFVTTSFMLCIQAFLLLSPLPLLSLGRDQVRNRKAEAVVRINLYSPYSFPLFLFLSTDLKNTYFLEFPFPLAFVWCCFFLSVAPCPLLSVHFRWSN